MADAEVNAVVTLEAAVQQFTQDMKAAADSASASMQGMVDNLGKNLSEVKTKMHETSESAKEEGKAFGKNFGEGLMLIGAALGTEFLLRIKENINEASEYAEQLGTLEIETGDSPAKLQELSYAFSKVGVSSQRAGIEFNVFQRRIQDAAQGNGQDLLTRMGLDPKKMANQGISQNVDELSDAMSRLRTSGEKTAAATFAFGRSGYELLPILDGGSKAIEGFKSESVAMGAVLGDETKEKLEKLRATLTGFGQTVQVFYAEFGAPFVDGVTKIVQTIERLFASFEKLDSGAKMAIVIGALTITFIQFESAVGLLKKAFVGIVPEEIFGAFEGLQAAILPVTLLAGAFFAAYTTNFAGFRDVVQTTVVAAEQFFGRLQKAVQAAFGTISKIVGPAIQDLGDALYPFIQALSEDLANALASIDFKSFQDAVVAVARGLHDGIEELANFARGIRANQDAIENFGKVLLALAVAVGTKSALFVGFSAILEIVNGLKLAMAVLEVETIPALVAVLATDLVAACGAAATALFGLSAAEGEATLGIAPLIATIVTGLTFALVFLVTNWQNVVNFLRGTWSGTVDVVVFEFATFLQFIALIIRGLGELYTALGSVLPGFKDIGTAADDAANKLDKYATALQKSTDAKNNAATPPAFPFSDVNAGGEDGKPKDAPKKEKSPGPTFDPAAKAKKGKSAGSLAEEDIKRIEEPLKALERTLALVELQSDKTETAIKKLGDIDTLDKFSQQYTLLGKQVEEAQSKLRVEQQIQRETQAIVNQLGAARKRAHDPEAVRRYGEAIDQEKQKEIAAEAAVQSAKQAVYAKQDEQLKSAYGKAKLKSDLGEDENTNSFAARITAAQEYFATLSKLPTPIDKLNAAFEKTLSLMKEARDNQLKVASLEDDKNTETIEQRERKRNDTPIDKDDQADIHLRDVANASDEVAKAQIKVAAAAREAQAATEAQNAQHSTDSATAARLSNDTTEAANKLIAANHALQDAQLKEAAIIAQTSPAVDAVRSGLLGIAQQAAPEVVQAFKLIQEGVNPLVSLFLELFSKSQAFKLIQEVLGAIMSRIAQIFNALRPVLEVLLGVLVGVVNVFLTFYNIIATVISLFGIHIQKIKLLNDNLDNLDTTVKPLIEIVHDLPTIDQYNKGQTGDLQAQQDQSDTDQITDSANVNADQQLSKLGEIAGTLLAIKLAIGVLGGQSLGSQAGGIFGTIGKLFGFGGSSSSSNGPTTGPIQGDDGTFGDDAAAADDSDLENLNSTISADVAVTTSHIDAMQASTKATTAGTTAFSSAISALSIIAPAIGNAIGSKIGGPAGAAVGSAIAGLPSILGALGKKATGASNTLGFIGSGLSLFQGLSQGGTFSETLSGIGGAIGTAFGGPLGTALGSTLGGIVGSFFGPHPTAYKDPDQLDATNYQQDVANLTGKAGDHGSVKENANMSSLFGGQTGIAEIEETLAKYGTAANAPAWLQPSFDKLEAMFGESATGSGKLNFGKNIGNQNITGAEGVSGQIYRYNDLNSALTDFATAMAGAGTSANSLNDSMQTLLTGATSLDLASIFGNSAVSAVSGGYMVGGAGSGTATASAPTQAQQPIFNVNIASLVGSDEDTLRTAFRGVASDMMDEYARRDLTARRTLSFVSQTGTN